MIYRAGIATAHSRVMLRQALSILPCTVFIMYLLRSYIGLVALAIAATYLYMIVRTSSAITEFISRIHLTIG